MAMLDDYAGNMVRFYKRAKEIKWKSREAGHPVYEDVDYIEIHKPGSKNQIIDRPVKDEDQGTYSRQWEAYKAGEDQPIDGLPLDMWPQVTPAQIALLKHHKVMSVEQLAALPEGQAVSLGREGITLRNKAKSYLEAAEDKGKLSERLTALEEQTARSSEREAEMRETISLQAAEIERLQAAASQAEPAKPKRGRPRKNPAPLEGQEEG